MSFVLLLIALVGFDVQADKENTRAMQVHFDDISNRIATSVLNAVQVGVERAASEADAPSDELVFTDRLRIPTQVRGQTYSITLTNDEITVASDDGDVTDTAPLYNLRIPALADCDETQAVCLLSGSVRSSDGVVSVMYEFKRTGSSTCPSLSTPSSCITLG